VGERLFPADLVEYFTQTGGLISLSTTKESRKVFLNEKDQSDKDGRAHKEKKKEGI